MRDLSYRIQAWALRGLLAAVAWLPLARRRAIVGCVTEALVRASPLRRRAERNLGLVWPDMAPAVRARLVARVGRNAGRTLTGIWFNGDLAREAEGLAAEGPGLSALRAAKSEGRGALIVSGHFGEWEAIRHVLRREGMETGALYRPNNNPYYEPIFRAGIELGGQPIVPKGPGGMRVMLKHLRGGGFMAILADQHIRDGAVLGFLGHPATTTLSPAELALRYGVPLVPAFAPWEDGRRRIVIEAPIPEGTPEEMMAAFNARLGAWVERHPSQWHWLHDRWKRYN
ncbi:lysophospholipid acyltransferase family protein [Jannaschia seohaensis]|uniref:KDO2-lipid IV(A) lauroyltransferase n=1 Tax=Jannaschia seohaensis TaxID=475081 RepID=A0A2Y9AXU4_9RHOB|nr:lysophospholipid acyltransferase family protein [Jannaschia seohaensis]PWJ16138.1 KDO2-lipid IV(A) lauroyltransferase [Jannaschia seohaensis]SSA49061.1 KDO2-lipid IV(A) lauroyltransferase [Jannaschia seohaensis]